MATTGGGIRFDIENQLSVAQVFPGAATVTQNSYMKASGAQDLTIGRRVSMVIFPLVAPTGNITAEVIEATDGLLTTSVSSLASVTVLAAAAAVGYPIIVPLPQGASAGKQYIGGRIATSAGTLTCDIYLMPDDEIPHKFKGFPKVNEAVV